MSTLGGSGLAIIALKVHNSRNALGPNPTAEQMYEGDRHSWIVDPDRREPDYAFAVLHGYVDRVYQIFGWDPDPVDDRRSVWRGRLDKKLTAEWAGTDVKREMAGDFALRYFGC